MGSERCTWKLSDFHKCLGERGVVRPFTGSEDVSKQVSIFFFFGDKRKFWSEKEV